VAIGSIKQSAMPACPHRAGKCPKSKSCRDGCADELCSAAEKFNSALVKLDHPPEQRNFFADGTERWMGRNEAVGEPVAWGLGAGQSSG